MFQFKLKLHNILNNDNLLPYLIKIFMEGV